MSLVLHPHRLRLVSLMPPSGLNIGDYIMVGNEMMRIKNTSISVFRGVFGTESTNHPSGSIIKKVRVVPVELRRGSLIRAQTRHLNMWFRSGNYSVALLRNRLRFCLLKIKTWTDSEEKWWSKLLHWSE